MMTGKLEDRVFHLCWTLLPSLYTLHCFFFSLFVSPQVVPRFAKKVNRTHLLYRRQQAAVQGGGGNAETLRELESKCVQETETVLENFNMDRLSEMDDLFKDCVDSELKFYK